MRILLLSHNPLASHLMPPNQCLATKYVHAVFQDIDGLERREFWGHVGLRKLGICRAMAALRSCTPLSPDLSARVVLATAPFAGASALGIRAQESECLRAYHPAIL
jgi:hypothetical protein